MNKTVPSLLIRLIFIKDHKGPTFQMLADSELSIRAHQSCQLACHFKAKTFTSFYHDGRPSPKSCNKTTRHPAQPGCCVVLSLLMALFNLAQLYFTLTYIKAITSSFSSGSWWTRTTLKANQKNTLSKQIMTQFSTAMKSSWENVIAESPATVPNSLATL